MLDEKDKIEVDYPK